jgi:hypothetical protein
MILFNRAYFGITVCLFAIEVLIALYVDDSFVRPYLGDVLVVILIYSFIKSFLDLSVGGVALAVLLFSFFIEFLQYLNFVEMLGLTEGRLANIIFGNSFSWLDILAYCSGIVLILFIEKFIGKKNWYSLFRLKKI